MLIVDNDVKLFDDSFQITVDEDILPGSDGKIVAWVDED